MKWIDVENKSWDKFYSFLEKLAEKAKEMLVLQNTVLSLGYGNSKDSSKFSSCGKNHSGQCNKPRAVASTKSSSNSSVFSSLGPVSLGQKCKICSGSAHYFFNKTKEKRMISNKPTDCPK